MVISLPPYTSDEIKKQLDEAVKKIRDSIENATPEQTEQGSSAVFSQEEASTSVNDSFDAEKTEVFSEYAMQPSDEITTPETVVTEQQAPQSQKHTTGNARPKAQPQNRNTAGTRSPAPDGNRRRPPSQRADVAKSGSANVSNSTYRKDDVRSFNISPDGALIEVKNVDDNHDIGPDDFKIKFDFESAYRDVPEEKPLRFRREKRTGCVGGLLYSVFVICVSLVLASLVWLAATDVLGFGTIDETINVTVPKEFLLDDIIDMLYDTGLIKYKFLFRIYAEYSHADEKIAAGSYVLNRNYDYRALVHGMTTRGGTLVETTVTIPEGFTLAEIFKRLEENQVCSAADLWNTAANYDFEYSFIDRSTRGMRYRLEGFLFPDTYNFYLDSSPVQVINRLLTEFDRRFTETFVERAEDMGYSVRDIITIASMIEREAGSDEERPRIAAVIYNRLNDDYSFPFLQIDATIYYAIAGTERPFSIDIDSPYNTYTHEGLPPGPIANPGMESIRAALYPDSTNEYFYALNMENTHEFFRTRAQHEAFVESDEYGGRR